MTQDASVITTRQADGALLFVLTCAMGVGPLLNYGLSTVSPLIIADLRISEAQFGLLITAVFASAAVSSVWLGRLSDRISNKAQLILIFGGTAAALVVAALSNHYVVLLLAAVLAGPSQAISNPTTNHIIIHHVDPPRRPGWIGIKQSGVQGCQFFSGLFFPAVALWAGWHGAAALAAVVAVGLMVYGLKHLPQAKPATVPGPAAASHSTSARAPALAGFPVSVWIFGAYALLSGVCMQATNVYLPLFTLRELDFSLVMGGVAMGVAGVVGVVSRIMWGRQMAKGVRASTLLMVLGAGALLGAAALLAAGETDDAVLLWLGVALHGATVMGANVVVMAGLMKVVPSARVGAASGIVAMMMYAGFAAGPLLMGLLVERTGSFRASWILIGVGYLLCVLLAFVLRLHGNRPGAVR